MINPVAYSQPSNVHAEEVIICSGDNVHWHLCVTCSRAHQSDSGHTSEQMALFTHSINCLGPVTQSWHNLWVASFEQIKHLPSLSISIFPPSFNVTLSSYALWLLVISTTSQDFLQSRCCVRGYAPRQGTALSSVNKIKHEVHRRPF